MVGGWPLIAGLLLMVALFAVYVYLKPKLEDYVDERLKNMEKKRS